MARVNHKRVKQLLNEKRSRITDRQFFTSRILAGHFEDMAMAQTRRRYKYNRRIHVAISWSPKSGEVACTNNLSVLINAGHRLVTQNRGRENRYEIVCGLFAHELGHCLYTDSFLPGQTYNNYLSREKWYPEPPVYKLPKDTVSERALWGVCKGWNRGTTRCFAMSRTPYFQCHRGRLYRKSDTRSIPRHAGQLPGSVTGAAV